MNKEKSKKTMMLVALILIIIIATFITRFYTEDKTWPTSENTSSSTEMIVSIPDDWLFAESDNFSFKYPEGLGTKYMTLVDWPIKINIYEEEYSCLEAGIETLPAGETKKESVEGREYCVTKESEGAAGSTYTNYAYSFPYEGKTLIMTFTLRATQCMNYDDPEQSECLLERESLNISTLIDKIANTIKIKD